MRRICRLLMMAVLLYPGTIQAVDWTPTALAGCVIWLKADAIVGLNDGDVVDTWADLSGLGHDVTAATTARPTYKTGILNGMPVVRFNGTSNQMKTAAFTFNQPSTVFLVGKGTNVSGGHTLTDGLSTNQRRIWGSTTMMQIYGGAEYDFSRAITWSNYALFGAIFNGASSLADYSGYTGSGNAGAGSGSGVTLMNLGGGGSYYVAGDLAEVVGYSSALSDTNRQILEGYLACRWGLQAGLPAGHPYKTSCPEIPAGGGGAPTRRILNTE